MLLYLMLLGQDMAAGMCGNGRLFTSDWIENRDGYRKQ